MTTQQTSAADRRSPGTNRVPFDAMVEVGGQLGPTFEAQAVNLSEGGMHLRTAYLPEIGQELHCRFDAGPGDHLLVTGEVLWREDFGTGGEFGIRFREMDQSTGAALERICGFANPAHGVGSRVRLHIDGLASPMRARIRDVRGANIVAYSELGFLQMGRSVELEDASTGERRPAHVDQVEVETDGSSHVPQLVVSMKYDDDQRAHMSSARMDHADMRHHDDAVMPEGDEPDVGHDHVAPDPFRNGTQASFSSVDHEDTTRTTDPGLDPVSNRFHESDTDKNAVEKMRGFAARTAGKVGPAVTRLAGRTKTAIGLLWAKRKHVSDARRVTAPAPQGVLHSGRGKVTRDSFGEEIVLPMSERLKDSLAQHKTKVAVGAIAVGLGIIGVASMGHGSEAARAEAITAGASAGQAVPMPPVEIPAIPQPMIPAQPSQQEAANGMEGGKAQPFTNGAVTHPKVMRVKMDGPIGRIEGAAQPSGFTINLPGRKSLEGKSALAGKDSRISNVKFTPEASGTELTLEFKDSVPNYVVRAKGDVLEIALDAPKPGKHHAKHGKKGHKH